MIAPVTPRTRLTGGDLLTFVGRVDDVVDLQTTRGLMSTEHKHLERFNTARHTFFEVVLGPASPLVGRTLKAAGFRDRYQAAVVAIHRAGRRVSAKLGGVLLKPGDTLLVLSDPGFGNRWRDRSTFLLVARLGGVTPAATKQAWVVGAVVLGVVLSAALGLVPVLNAALVGAFALVLSGVLTPAEARTAVDLDVILVIAGAFGLAAALQVSGLAEDAAGLLVATFGGWGSTGVMIGIVLTTVTLISIISNNAAAVLMFPIAISTASGLGLNRRTFAIAVAIAASASFLTPIAYQTNIMVYGPGGYRFGDFARLGAPLTLVVVAAIAWLVPSSGPWGSSVPLAGLTIVRYADRGPGLSRQRMTDPGSARRTHHEGCRMAARDGRQSYVRPDRRWRVAIRFGPVSRATGGTPERASGASGGTVGSDGNESAPGSTLQLSGLSPACGAVFRCSTVRGRYRDHASANIRLV